MGGLSLGALDGKAVNGTRTVAYTGLFAVLTANALTAPFMGTSVMKGTQRLLGTVVSAVIFVWVALQHKPWLVLVTVPAYAFAVCALRYSVYLVDGEYAGMLALIVAFSLALLQEKEDGFIIASASWRCAGLCFGIVCMTLFLLLMQANSTKEVNYQIADALEGLLGLTRALSKANADLAAPDAAATGGSDNAPAAQSPPVRGGGGGGGCGASSPDAFSSGGGELSAQSFDDAAGLEEEELRRDAAENAAAALQAQVATLSSSVAGSLRVVHSQLVNTGYELYIGRVRGWRVFLPLPRRGMGVPPGPAVQATARIAELLQLLSSLTGDLEAIRGGGAGGGTCRAALLEAYGGVDVVDRALRAAEAALEVHAREMASCCRRGHLPRAPLPATALAACINACKWAFKKTLQADYGLAAASTALGALSGASLASLTRVLQQELSLQRLDGAGGAGLQFSGSLGAPAAAAPAAAAPLPGGGQGAGSGGGSAAQQSSMFLQLPKFREPIEAFNPAGSGRSDDFIDLDGSDCGRGGAVAAEA
ncbi:hypothetical protein MNEG_12888 [Monoraphidium neglectum]|uniref:Integral membrane bound transporter domain-containing protein n=1 Tax=Monoraphidium neglectum TaxID=145388 RepID=A0A0D2KH04_9CHLO|nr:hypothetical protein MNEG_12888 [Monoraphidium neglectum]KIY95073.1 hypothetical protein MNEG_12888 [Monoraphidium neglectum]|eukprot:XP_013894093.1 hypothetical protein MNEG_12888 [Monoraphidium neglectum]